MGFFSRLTFLGRMVIISIIVAAVGFVLHYTGAVKAGAEYYSNKNANATQTEVVSEQQGDEAK